MPQKSAHPDNRSDRSSSSSAGRGAQRQSDSTISGATSREESDAPASTTLEQQQQHELTDTDRLAQILESVGADAGGGFTAYIDRIPRPGVVQDVSGYLGPMEFTTSFLDDVMAVHGGGKFRARIHNARGRYKASFTFTIAGPPKSGSVGAAGGSSLGGGPSAESPSYSRLERMIEGLIDELRTARQPSRSATSSLDEVIKVAEALKALTPAPAPAAPAASPKDMLEMIETVMDIRERVAESVPRGRPSDFVEAVEHGVKPLVSLGGRYLDIQERAMELRAQGKLPPRSARSTRPPGEPGAAAAARAARETRVTAVSGTTGGTTSAPPNATSTAAPADAIGQSAADDPVARLARAVPRVARMFLTGHAAAGNDPETYAIMALDTIETSNPDVYAELPALLERADFTDRMLEQLPEWATHREWFAQMFADMQRLLADTGAEPGDDREPATGAAGAAGAAGADAGAQPPGDRAA